MKKSEAVQAVADIASDAMEDLVERGVYAPHADTVAELNEVYRLVAVVINELESNNE